MAGSSTAHRRSRRSQPGRLTGGSPLPLRQAPSHRPRLSPRIQAGQRATRSGEISPLFRPRSRSRAPASRFSARSARCAASLGTPALPWTASRRWMRRGSGRTSRAPAGLFRTSSYSPGVGRAPVPIRRSSDLRRRTRKRAARSCTCGATSFCPRGSSPKEAPRIASKGAQGESVGPSPLHPNPSHLGGEEGAHRRPVGWFQKERLRLSLGILEERERAQAVVQVRLGRRKALLKRGDRLLKGERRLADEIKIVEVLASSPRGDGFDLHRRDVAQAGHRDPLGGNFGHLQGWIWKAEQTRANTVDLGMHGRPRGRHRCKANARRREVRDHCVRVERLGPKQVQVDRAAVLQMHAKGRAAREVVAILRRGLQARKSGALAGVEDVVSHGGRSRTLSKKRRVRRSRRLAPARRTKAAKPSSPSSRRRARTHDQSPSTRTRATMKSSCFSGSSARKSTSQNRRLALARISAGIARTEYVRVPCATGGDQREWGWGGAPRTAAREAPDSLLSRGRCPTRKGIREDSPPALVREFRFPGATAKWDP